ncbi:hypothetical protein [Amycolatopsis sp. YIM 10]|uniref:hypothetical protein n=1 Tax=Amycolatopsis sp. YIM 10 TaxID=2653857 RepID=UPI00128FD463|nr:hypothetical protein [Amycolatopsis sp. YIM 10]QFU87839.1 hypothetical protein YIM_13265 [Amycolatopsis sp. YIM 10]QFU94848.1 hypothetical protein YIM_48615 [Amycolatopsis sp. YIM 10]
MATEDKPLHVQQAEALRRLADLIEATPEIEACYLRAPFTPNIWHLRSAAELGELARAALRLGARVEKEAASDVYDLQIHFGASGFSALAPRGDVCERVVTGTEVITKKVPDPILVAQVPEVEVLEEVEIVEWRCTPLLAQATTPAALPSSSDSAAATE